jgi:histidinol-phosphate aminotransferase
VSWLTDIARPEIRALRAYEHASWEPGLVRLHANESPWRADADRSVEGLNRYPEPHPYALIARLAEFYGVAGDCLLAARGSDEAIDLLIRAYCRSGEHAIMITPPTFGMYSVAARIQGAAVIEVPLRREQDFALDAAALRAAFSPAVRLIFLCSPNNPTGNLIDATLLLQLAREAEGRALVVVDEAYVEFAGRDSLAAAVRTHPALVVLRTLSKAHALAGARCGALIAQPEIISLLHKVIQPYAVTQLSIEAVFAALQPAGVAAARARVAQLIDERERLSAALGTARGVVRVWPSAANFLLVEFADAGEALRRTHAAGLLVRDFRTALGLGQSLRISVGTPRQNDRLIASLSA